MCDFCETSAQCIEVDLLRDAPLQDVGLPAWVRSVVTGPLTVRHRSTWRRLDATYAQATLQIQPTALPVRADAVGPAVEAKAGTTQVALSWRVRSDVALIGARIERLFAAQLRAALDADDTFTAAYLEAHR